MTAGFIGLFLIGQRFAELLHRYGYGAVAGGVLLENLGVPVPGEAMFMGAAALAQQGELHLPFVYLTGVLSAIAGDNLGFEVGRKFGRNVITRHFPRIFTEERMAKADRFFERRGRVAVFLARFIPGVRVVAAVSAGASQMRRIEFVVANALGAMAWGAWVSALGWYGSEVGKRAIQALIRLHLLGWVLVIAALLATLAWLRFHRPGKRGLTGGPDQG